MFFCVNYVFIPTNAAASVGLNLYVYTKYVYLSLFNVVICVDGHIEESGANYGIIIGLKIPECAEIK